MPNAVLQQTLRVIFMLLLALLLSLFAVPISFFVTNGPDISDVTCLQSHIFLQVCGALAPHSNTNRIKQHSQVANAPGALVQLASASMSTAAIATSRSRYANWRPVQVFTRNNSSSSDNICTLSSCTGSSQAAISAAISSQLLELSSSSGSVTSSTVRVVLAASKKAQIDTVWAHASVKAVALDTPAAVQAVRCASIETLSAGIRGTPTAAFNWPGCRSTKGISNKFVWIGQRCGSNMQSIQYIAIYAVASKGRSEVAASELDGRPCAIIPDPNDKPWTRRFFGSGCRGKAPATAPSLPTLLCNGAATTAPCFAGDVVDPAAAYVTATIALASPVTCGSSNETATVLQYRGRPCGPRKQYIEWFKATAPAGCTINRDSFAGTSFEQIKAMFNVFGYCGSNPGLTSDLQGFQCFKPVGSTPPDIDPSSNYNDSSTCNTTDSAGTTGSTTSPALPRSPVKAGEAVPKGVQRIEAAAGTVVDLRQLPAAQLVVVAVIDSGIDRTHPDLNYFGGQSWVTASDLFPNDADPGVDNYGHGTMVAGVIGAKNNGAGVVGVSPGLPLYSLKVVDGHGEVKSSNVIRALQWAIEQGRDLGIRVINLSLAVAQTDPDADPVGFQALVDLYCPMIRRADEAEILVVVAAGNYGSSLMRYVPGLCPYAAVVTGVDFNFNQPSSTTNYLPANASAADKARVVAAPGVSIQSTAPVADFSGFYELSGSSMAAPHVAAVAANCLMSGACPANSTGSEILTKIQAAAAERTAADGDPSFHGGSRFGFRGDPASPDQSYAGRYYGYMVWAKW